MTIHQSKLTKTLKGVLIFSLLYLLVNILLPISPVWNLDYLLIQSGLESENTLIFYALALVVLLVDIAFFKINFKIALALSSVIYSSLAIYQAGTLLYVLMRNSDTGRFNFVYIDSILMGDTVLSLVMVGISVLLYARNGT